eukprot:3004840-Rhodomonas_salina.2
MFQFATWQGTGHVVPTEWYNFWSGFCSGKWQGTGHVAGRGEPIKPAHPRRASNPDRPPTLAMASLLDMNASTTLNYIDVPGRGLCVPMLDVVCAATGKSRNDGQKWVWDMLKGKEAEEFAAFIGAKIPGVPTYTGPTWVL